MTLNSGQDQVTEPVNLCAVAGVDDRSGINLLNDCRSCQDAAGPQAVAVIDGAFNIAVTFGKVDGSGGFLRCGDVCIISF